MMCSCESPAPSNFLIVDVLKFSGKDSFMIQAIKGDTTMMHGITSMSLPSLHITGSTNICSILLTQSSQFGTRDTTRWFQGLSPKGRPTFRDRGPISGFINRILPLNGNSFPLGGPTSLVLWDPLPVVIAFRALAFKVNSHSWGRVYPKLKPYGLLLPLAEWCPHCFLATQTPIMLSNS